MLEHIFKLENRIMLDAVSPVADVDILVVSKGIDDYADLAAAANDVEVIEYDPDAENALDTLLQDIENIAGDSSVDGISIASHGDSELITSETFLNGVANILGDGGRLDILACDSTPDTLNNIQNIVGNGIEVFASEDITGNTNAGGDWELELSTTGVAMDLTGNDGYLDANALAAFDGSLKTNNVSITNGTNPNSSSMTYVDADTIVPNITATTATSQIVIDLSNNPSPTVADRTVTFNSGVGSDNRIFIASDDTKGTFSLTTGKIYNTTTGWDQNQNTIFTLFDINNSGGGIFKFNPDTTLPEDADSDGTNDPDAETMIIKPADATQPGGYDNTAKVSTKGGVSIANINSFINGIEYIAPTAGGIYAIVPGFDTDNIAISDVKALFFVEVIPYVVPFTAPDYTPLDEIPQDTFPADFTNQQYRNLPYDPLNVFPPDLINVAPLELYNGTEFVSIDVLQSLSMSERDMDSSYFAKGVTGDPSQLASTITYGELAMGVPDFLTHPEIDSVIYMANYKDATTVYTEPTAADIMKLGYYPSQWEVIDVDSYDSGYYIKIEDNIYYINLKSPIEYCGARVAYNGAADADIADTPLIDDNFISQHLKHLKKVGKAGLFNNFKKVSICDQ